VSLPVATVDGCPVGLGVIGPRGSDEELLRLTEKLVPLLVPSAGS
jgi:amidase